MTLFSPTTLYNYDTAVSRNLGFITNHEQSVLRHSHVAIAGAGGDGGMLAVQLARLGVGGITLADPEDFELENVNRQAEASMASLGQNKAEVVGAAIRQIAPDANVRVFRDGVTPSNVDEFFDGADLLLDETEITTPDVAVMLARHARRLGISNMTVLNIGFAGLATSFEPSGVTLEEVLGIDQAGCPVDVSRWLPYIPPYVSISTLQEFAAGERPAPTVAIGVSMAASVGAAQAMLHLLHAHGPSGRPKPVIARQALVIDAMTARVSRLRMSRWTHRRHIAQIILRDRFRRPRY